MENRHKVFNLIILDESGSMQSIKRATIQGFNEVVQTIRGVEQQFPEQEHFISLVTFNGLGIKTRLALQPVASLEEIDGTKFRPDASTPLFDALGYCLTSLRNATGHLDNYNVLVTILTDGEENASAEYSGAAIKGMIDELSLKNWTFTYIGANHDVAGFALKISVTNTMTFQSNEEDMKRMFEREKNARMNYSRKIRDKEDFKKGFYDEEAPGNQPSS
jgi:Mg-chelatase subunit ChlD